MKISIGTPPVEILGILDTGSDLTWIQCKPCYECYNQTSPIFDPKKTKTYRQVSCQSQQCSNVGSFHCDRSNGCNYELSYGDDSYSVGDLAVDTFTFDSKSRKSVSFPKVVFGCGHRNHGTFKKTDSGIIGLGRGPLSIIKQLDKSINGRFSYCLTFIDSNATSKISFGREAIVKGPKVKSTPIVSKYLDIFYHLTLEGISVGRERLAYNSISNSKESVKEGNIIIDSGTTLSYVPREFYNKLESTLVKTIKGKRAAKQGPLNLCYAVPKNGKFNPPPIVAHFRGADVELRQESTFLEVDKGIVCLTFAPSPNLAIFGNLHQMNYHIEYDLKNNKLPLTVELRPSGGAISGKTLIFAEKMRLPFSTVDGRCNYTMGNVAHDKRNKTPQPISSNMPPEAGDHT
ncbi:hypothetical protein RD792_001584 [Penstemon davidsonii]|uniref:Peptidase A1 domain-containing protein n=1 Tax=Penstemon davidsonii TaxID=160366 RepID=A0ABR0DNR8_9LAMI|nr:hypothetical protein RD792_001584 [Penstemon davidsonii]